MKKKCFFVVLVAFVFCFLISCGTGKSNNATIQVKNGAYDWTAQDLIDALNAEIEETGDSRFLRIPDFNASDEKIVIDDSSFEGLTLTLSVNTDGYITKIVIDWTTFKESLERVNTCGLIIGRLVGSIAPDEYDAIYDQLDMDAPGTSEYTTSASANGTDFNYKYQLNGMYQTLTITPALD